MAKVTVTTCKKPYSIQVVIEGELPKSSNSMLGRNPWHARNNAKKWRNIIRNSVVALHPESPLTNAKIHICRHNWKMLDYDGLVASMKPLVDGLVDGGILKNDTYKITGPWNVLQEFRPRKLGPMIEIWVYDTSVGPDLF